MTRREQGQGIRGVVVPILTPLTPDEEVDVASLRRLTNYGHG